MSNIFAGLENFGLKDAEAVEVFHEEKEKENGTQENVKKEVLEEDLLFDKSYTCPVCDKEFKSKVVRTGKVRLIGADTDLRPKYKDVDSLKYDAILCPNCGYAALNRYFNFVMANQAKSIKEKISQKFKYEESSDPVYSYDEAISRHKMALLNTVVKNGKSSERAYTCLKLAWLCRGKREECMQSEALKDDIQQLAKEEIELLQNAFDGFEKAFMDEDFPMCGMDQYTMMYLLGELARRLGKIDAAKRYVSKVLVARDAQRRIKSKALDLKELLLKKTE